ncbi:hypothetical protein [Lentibacillus salicampi]|uniref:Uncharacterized protein n=1 Tax=Lentibacillus salicampi TaxID=175306 RepID=A0A4Y9ACX7_9BACI|nr:hypothetical protein [Lentibacillus salicampi]TFJ93653.1 hypothetical protein E4U82_06765 [Lentibacillus salicampi]
MNKTVLEVLKVELKGLKGYTDDELEIYLHNNDLDKEATYDKSMRIALLEAALEILNSMANNQSYFASKQHEDFSVSDFATNLQNRIDQLTVQIRKLKAEKSNSPTFMLFNE